MIDRTTFDLRIAAHHTTTARINAHEWQRQGQATRSAMRAKVAVVLVALAARLDPTDLLTRQDAQALAAPTNA